jgi:hypothetical protein
MFEAGQSWQQVVRNFLTVECRAIRSVRNFVCLRIPSICSADQRNTSLGQSPD